MKRATAHPRLGQVVVGPVEEGRTFVLRQAVLRPHQRVEEMAVSGATANGAVTLAASTVSGEVVSTCTVVPDAPPAGLAMALGCSEGWRLRAMATRADVQGAGIGTTVLAAALEHAAAQGGGVLWCNARLGAVGFYERAGFERWGEEFMEPHIGPHVVMWRSIP